MPYSELLEEYSYTYSNNNTSAVRVFIDDASGAEATLPALNTQFPSDIAAGTPYIVPVGLVLQDVTLEPYKSATDRTDASYKYVLSYSIKPTSLSAPEPEDEPEDLEVGMDGLLVQSIGDTAFDEETSGDAIITDIVVPVVTATYSKTQVYDTLQDAADTAKPYIGKVLDKGDTKDGYWLCLGISITEYRDNDGELKFNGTRKYQYKRNQYKASNYGWNYIWKPKGGDFVLPTNKFYPITTPFPDTMPDLGP